MMEWATQNPATSGLYWFRYSVRHPRMLMEIYIDFTGRAMGKRIANGCPEMLDLSAYGEGCEWAGPIPEPKD